MDPVSVLYRSIEDMSADSSIQIWSMGLADWLALFCRLHGVALERHALHRRILQSIPSPCLFAAASAGDEVGACGLGVLDGECFGLFDLVTAPKLRRRGLGLRLVSGMLDWARSRGASSAYLQVVEGDRPARHLYRKLGFEELYHYWYRAISPEKSAE